MAGLPKLLESYFLSMPPCSMFKPFILTLGMLVYGVSAVCGSEEAPLCLAFDDGANFCSSAKLANGARLSSVMNAVLRIPLEGRSTFDPKPFNETILLPPDVPITTDELDKGGERLFEFLHGPESLAKSGNFLYTSAMDGIYRVDLETGREQRIFNGNAECKDFCSRPLGIRVHGQTMFCADLLKGLVEIDLRTEKSKVLLPVGSLIGGVKLSFPNDVAIDQGNHVIYLSDSDTKRGWDDFMFSLLEFDNNSRIIQYNLTSGEAKVFADGLHFANGVQISNDGKSLLVNEFTARRVVKFPLGGSLPAKGSAFSDYLPGNADNIRPSKRGGYWVALVGSRADGTRALLEELQARPTVSKRILDWLVTGGAFLESVGAMTENKAFTQVANELKNGNILGSSMPTSGAIAELDANGKVLRVLHSTKYGDLSEVLDDDGYLYIGSYLQKGIVRISAGSLRRET